MMKSTHCLFVGGLTLCWFISLASSHALLMENDLDEVKRSGMNLDPSVANQPLLVRPCRTCYNKDIEQLQDFWIKNIASTVRSSFIQFLKMLLALLKRSPKNPDPQLSLLINDYLLCMQACAFRYT